ncbi:MAG TPA: hypothetical protein VLA16_27080 [Ideonella sp.]|nr:hypothetical protein [Ideonella sp.]
MKAALKHRRVHGKAAASESAVQPLRPQCPCCAPQAEVKRPSQRLAERLAALRQRTPLPLD